MTYECAVLCCVCVFVSVTVLYRMIVSVCVPMWVLLPRMVRSRAQLNIYV